MAGAVHFHVASPALIFLDRKRNQLAVFSIFNANMGTKVCKIEIKDNSQQYAVEIGNSLLGGSGQWAKTDLSVEAETIAMISNEKVFDLYGATVKTSLMKSGFKIVVFLMGDGEEYKNFDSSSGF